MEMTVAFESLPGNCSYRLDRPEFRLTSGPEVDRLHSLAITSLEGDSRRQAAVGLNKRLSELVGYGPLYYNVEILLARSRLTGPVGEGLQTGVTWNVFEWEVTD